MIALAMLALPKLIEPLFHAAGWKRSEHLSTAKPQSLSASGAASRILDEFRGLTVGACGPGTEMAASDVHFFMRLRAEDVVVAKAWERQIGQVVAFATAHHDHMLLLVGTNRTFYVFTDPDDRLYAGGSDFGELMRRLLWGYDFGPEITKDIEHSQ